MPVQRAAIVTGASRGIGSAIATRLHESGYELLTASRGATDPRPQGWEHLLLDLGTREGVDALLAHPIAARATVLVNNVGQISAVGGIAAEDPASLTAAFATNFFGPMECVRRLAPGMKERGGGAVVNVSSIYGPINQAYPVMGYAASKAALASATESLAVGLAQDRIRVNAVLPGNIDTAMTNGAGPEYVADVVARTPLGRLGAVAEIADAVEFLLGAEFVTGHLLVVDGGISLRGG